MWKYPKIPGMWKRSEDKDHRIIRGRWTHPYLQYLADNDWHFTEKLDGTNIRVGYNPEDSVVDGLAIRFGGRTDNAQLYVPLLDRLTVLFRCDKAREFFATFDAQVCLYGEGFGVKIQKAGASYLPTSVDFALFDVRVGDWWLEREDVNAIADTLGIRTVPCLGYGTLTAMERLVEAGFDSCIGTGPAEGIVARPVVRLSHGHGPILVKCKTRDYR